MNEFDPRSERHFPLLIIKAVEPGCTTEIQIENVETGEITRYTTTDDGDADDALFQGAVTFAWKDAWQAYQKAKL